MNVVSGRAVWGGVCVKHTAAGAQAIVFLGRTYIRCDIIHTYRTLARIGGRRLYCYDI